MLQKAFLELGLNDNHLAVYASLLEHGPSSAKQLTERLGFNRPTTYDYLKALMNKGLIMERFEGTKNLFQIDDPQHITRLLDEKVAALTEERARVASELPKLLTKAESIDPKFKFYSGREGVRQALNQIVYSGEKESIALWSIEDVVGLLGAEQMNDINEKRVRNELYVRSVWSYTPNVEKLSGDFNRLDQDSIREVRLAPKDMQTVPMGYWMAGNTAAFISSSREAYGFVIRSRDFTDFLRAQFEMVWSVSTLIVKD